MKHYLWILLLLCNLSFGFAQTDNAILNTQLNNMKTYFLKGDIEHFADYTYPKVAELMGGKAGVISATQQAMTTMKDAGFTITAIEYKDPTPFLKTENELQCSLTQVMLMETPNGTIVAEYTLIAISGDNGQNWTFLDTSGKDKATMRSYFPNLHPDIIIKERKQRVLE